MGLSEPRNRKGLRPDARAVGASPNQIGFKMLQAMGWKEGTGLGLRGDAPSEHFKIKVKADSAGVGAEAKDIHNWRSNADTFSNLLANLGQVVGVGIVPDVPMAATGTTLKPAETAVVTPPPSDGAATGSESEPSGKLSKADKKAAKKAAKQAAKAAKKAEKASKKVGKKSSKLSQAAAAAATTTATTTTTTTTTTVTTTGTALPADTNVLAARNWSRRKFLANKRVASFDAQALKEILGVDPSEPHSSFPSFTAVQAIDNSAAQAAADAQPRESTHFAYDYSADVHLTTGLGGLGTPPSATAPRPGGLMFVKSNTVIQPMSVELAQQQAAAAASSASATVALVASKASASLESTKRPRETDEMGVSAETDAAPMSKKAKSDKAAKKATKEDKKAAKEAKKASRSKV